ncbi:unnamed protein product [Rangifer tarandus platyrhynchus]|uniref:Uncharacterized protein n=1 Tax=Rangifer tarandus platyrhynchus TaxID=3082113 RepID=A0ABN8XNR6_RANTA|nr:unnamed protein product [Rangifer tarandus platyrhynchus]
MRRPGRKRQGIVDAKPMRPAWRERVKDNLEAQTSAGVEEVEKRCRSFFAFDTASQLHGCIEERMRFASRQLVEPRWRLLALPSWFWSAGPVNSFQNRTIRFPPSPPVTQLLTEGL